MKVIRFLFIGLLAVALCLIPFCRRGVKNSYEAMAEFPLLDCTIVIDAGHGGQDGGAIGIQTGVREREINLAVAQKLERLLQSCGASVVMTRTDENALCKDGFHKMEDMNARASIIEQTNPFIVISIHCNSFPESKQVRGAQVFYYPGSDSGCLLAQKIQSSLNEQVDELHDRNVKSEDFFMLRHGNSTNVLVECGFLSCPEEENLLCDETYQEKIAYAIFNGVCKYACRFE